jgi:hypothetical protein
MSRNFQLENDESNWIDPVFPAVMIGLLCFLYLLSLFWFPSESKHPPKIPGLSFRVERMPLRQSRILFVPTGNFYHKSIGKSVLR